MEAVVKFFCFPLQTSVKNAKNQEVSNIIFPQMKWKDIDFCERDSLIRKHIILRLRRIIYFYFSCLLKTLEGNILSKELNKVLRMFPDKKATKHITYIFTLWMYTFLILPYIYLNKRYLWTPKDVNLKSFFCVKWHQAQSHVLVWSSPVRSRDLDLMTLVGPLPTWDILWLHQVWSWGWISEDILLLTTCKDPLHAHVLNGDSTASQQHKWPPNR